MSTYDALYANEVARQVLALREALVRHDENLAAWTLLDQCVPYVCRDHPDVVKARADQREMVLHIIDPDEYAKYYSANPHEAPFEAMYGIKPEDAHLHLHRVEFARRKAVGRVLDVACNDGMLAVNLEAFDDELVVDGIDLNPGCIERAKGRGTRGQFWVGDGNEPPEIDGGYDTVVAFEVIEHVKDPRCFLETLVDYADIKAGRLLISTPVGAVERGNLPDWAHVEPKGHVRAYTPEHFQAELEAVGEIVAFETGPDGVMVAEVKPR